MRKDSFFIVFEGIDGSGTSTQASLLVRYLDKLNRRAVLTCEPSEGPVGSVIRQIMKHRIKVVSDAHKFDQQLAYLFAADRHDHLYNEEDGVMKFLAEGTTVVSTRYYFSSYAYHCNNDEDRKLIEDLNSRFPMPDLVIFLDHQVDKSLSRIAGRKYKEAYENEQKLISVASNYKKMFESYSGNLAWIDATRDIDSIHEDIISYVGKLYAS